MIKNIKREKAINYTLKICIGVFLLGISYFGLQFIILKGNLFKIEPLLTSFFVLYCFVVGFKIFTKRK